MGGNGWFPFLRIWLLQSVFLTPMACGCLVALAKEKGERQSKRGIFIFSVRVEFPFFLERELEAFSLCLGVCSGLARGETVNSLSVNP